MKEIIEDTIEVNGNELYQIPNHSRYYCNLEEGKIYDTKRETFLIANPNRNGYCYTSIANDQGEYKKYSVHTIIMMCYMGYNKPYWLDKKLEVHHINTIKSDNSIFNLSLIDRNAQYQCAITKKNIANRSNKRLKKEDVAELKRDWINWEGTKPEFCWHWSKKLRIEYRSIHNILVGHTYKSIEVE